MSDETYDLGSGLAFTSEVTDAYFETNDEWFNPEIPRLVIETADDRQIRLKVGKGWEIESDGKCVTHPTSAAPNKNSAYGRFITSVIKLDGGRELLESRGHATEAKIWKGLTLGLDSIEDEFTNDDGEKVPYQVQIVTSFKAPSKGAKKSDDAAEVAAKLEKLWAEVTPDHALFMERAYAEIPGVVSDPSLQKAVENTDNWPV